MTKKELVALLANVSDDTPILLECCARSNNFRAMMNQAESDWAVTGYAAELSELKSLDDYGEFVVLVHHLDYVK